MGIALFGGSFDPFHNGHLMILKELRKLGLFDAIYIVPSHKPPHKKSHFVSSFHRCEMIKIAIKEELENDEIFKINLFEINKLSYSWTIDTVRYFLRLDPTISLVMGEDSYLNLHKWKDYLRLIDLVDLCVLMRTCEGVSELHDYFCSHISDDPCYLKKIKFIKNSIIPISSTMIRDSILNETAVNYVSSSVLKYITTNNLYQKEVKE
ncbi:nicotinate (nicotinamide) nucleotide adenylyltransferase [Candidatus Marinamargulisbacteria bacterium SCGC AG-410-N11]|nr:nicotinate (nicotinamide) nucleotide adenylyltransferase [Candidatus Marinamargulisbacteria bacterium SCGC AG-410-N11]